ARQCGAEHPHRTGRHLAGLFRVQEQLHQEHLGAVQHPVPRRDVQYSQSSQFRPADSGCQHRYFRWHWDPEPDSGLVDQDHDNSTGDSVCGESNLLIRRETPAIFRGGGWSFLADRCVNLWSLFLTAIGHPAMTITDDTKTFVTAGPEPELAQRARHRIARRLLPFLFLLYVIAFLDRMNVGAAALQMPHDLGFSEGVIGFGAGVFFLGYFLLEIPGALIVG